MPFVLDASVAACWAFDDEQQPLATYVRDRLHDDEALVPSIWWFEVRNALIINERRGRVTAASITSFLRALGRVNVVTDGAPDETSLLALCRKHRLTVYDAAYLSLAQREALQLATLDSPLAHAARAEGVPLVTPKSVRKPRPPA